MLHASHKRVGQYAKALSVLCFYHCLLYLGLFSIVLIRIPSAQRYMPFVDNPLLHSVFAAFAMLFVGFHFVANWKSVHLTAFVLAFLALGLLCLSNMAEFWLSPLSWYEHLQSLIQLNPQPQNCNCGSLLHITAHLAFMTGNICLFVAHSLVDCVQKRD